MQATDVRNKERECELVVNVDHYCGLRSSYDVKNGLLQAFKLSGKIIDEDSSPYINKPAPFNNKPVRIEIYSKTDEEFLERICMDYTGGMGEPCGVVRVNAGVKPEQYENPYGEIDEFQPVSMDLFLTPVAFESIRRQVVEAHSLQLILRMQLTLFGEALLPLVRDKRMAVTIKPHELDVSVFHGYGVKHIVIFTTQIKIECFTTSI